LNLSYQILAACALDLALGDPHGFPHPVRAVGWMIVRSERLLRRCIPNLRVAGVLLMVAMGLLSGAGAWGLLWLTGRWHPACAAVLSIALLWTGFATRSLHRESAHVLRALRQGDLELARRNLSMIVGRDTAHLDEPEIVRAAVETIGENLCDGVIAPLVYAAIGGAPFGTSGTRNSAGRRRGWMIF
jgi:adenosylcobinamide-phosphate synthase